jgi:hypothetical protein
MKGRKLPEAPEFKAAMVIALAKLISAALRGQTRRPSLQLEARKPS